MEMDSNQGNGNWMDWTLNFSSFIVNNKALVKLYRNQWSGGHIV